MLPLDFTYELIFLRIDVLTTLICLYIFFIFIVVDDVIIRGQLSK